MFYPIDVWPFWYVTPNDDAGFSSFGVLRNGIFWFQRGPLNGLERSFNFEIFFPW